MLEVGQFNIRIKSALHFEGTTIIQLRGGGGAGGGGKKERRYGRER